MSDLAWRLRCAWAAAISARNRKALRRDGVPRRLLVVCHGNIMRSPYAAALLTKRLAGIATVRSAGFHPAVGRAPPAALVELARNAGVDLSTHRSSITSVVDLDRADLIVLMDRSNWRALVQLGANERKMMWLGAMDRRGELADPYGRPVAEMMHIMARLQVCCEALAQTIVQKFHQSANLQRRI